MAVERGEQIQDPEAGQSVQDLEQRTRWIPRPQLRAQRAAPPAPATSIFGEWIALRSVATEGQAGLPLTGSEEIARALRDSLMHHATDPPPSSLSGHQANGRSLDRPHAAFLALPGTDPKTVAGAAIVLPRGIAPEERQAILLAAARWERSGMRLVLGNLGAMQLARVGDETGAEDPLAAHRWLGPSRYWASVTPVALERNPGKLTARDPATAARAARRAEEIVSRGCAHVGLPPPARVRVMRRSVFPRVPPAPEFMPFPRKTVRAPSGAGRFQRVCVHVALEFDQPVEGPVLVGAGRYFGVGVLRPEG